MTRPTCSATLLTATILWLALGAGGVAQAQGPTPAPQPVQIPDAATVLEGIPTVREDSSERRSERRLLDPAEAASNRLNVRIREGKLYWSSQADSPLQLDAIDGFTYLSSPSRPGSYIKLTRLNDRITYVEHLDMPTGQVTYWGELRIVVGR